MSGAWSLPPEAKILSEMQKTSQQSMLILGRDALWKKVLLQAEGGKTPPDTVIGDDLEDEAQ